ncbi:glycosyltransferase family 2 protein [Naasia sp. SYSU D00948]|uniref:glycosyltransferase family 2 protein n=1 Tax=Naasia sp. SYSU D00948 TaxID=2817379 RepID=UPI001B31130B|nr:glycosyltransferase family 2 protein [Naasia sp. SYSU D00948]
MRPKVTAILVAHDGGAYLDRTLEALAEQTRQPDQLVIVDIGAKHRVTEHPATLRDVQHVAAPASLSFGEAVKAGVRVVAPASSDDEWLWLLSADNAPEPDALRALLAALEISPSVSVAGPKLMQWADPDYLYSFGDSITRFGTAVELAEPLLDQAQYDKESDVLAVAAAGMLVRHRLWDRLEGFDPGLPAFDDALDFCIRARLAGSRVSVVPDAKVLSAGRRAPGTAVLGPRTSRARRSYLARAAQLHRRLVYAPPLALPIHWLSLLPLAILRALGQLLKKQPGSVLSEIGAALAVAFGHARCIPAARRRLRRERTLGWSAIASLRLPWVEVRRRRALALEDAVSARRAGRGEVHFFTGGGAWTVLAAAVVGVAIHLPLLGASTVAAPGLLPLADLGALWGEVGYAWRSLGAGFTGAADPFAWVLALLGSVTFWAPSLSIVLLYLGALPLAALAAWLAAARLTRSAWLRIVAAAGWTLAPTFLVALDQGRIGAVVAHLLLPWLVFALTTARRSWAAAATASLLAAGVLAGAPSLALPLLAVWLLGTVALACAGRRGRGWHRLLALPLPAAVLFLPLAVQHALRGTPLGVLADPGVPLPSSASGDTVLSALGMLVALPGTDSTGWTSLGLLEPEAAQLLAVLVLTPVLALALASVFLPGAARSGLALAVAALGFGTAVLCSRLPVASAGEAAVTPWPGSALSLTWLGLLGAAVIGLSAGEGTATRVLRAALGGVAVVGVAASVLPLLGAAAVGTGGAVPGSSRTLPALVAAEASTDPTVGTLVLDAERGDGLAVAIERGAGTTLDEQSSLYSAAPASAALGSTLTELAANLASRSGYDPVPVLEAQRIGYVLLQPGDIASRAVHDRTVAALDANPLFTHVTDTTQGTLWRYTGLDDGLSAPAPTGPGNLDTALGTAILTTQLLVLLLTLLLALPTSGLADWVRPEREARRGSGLSQRGARTEAPARPVPDTASLAVGGRHGE